MTQPAPIPTHRWPKGVSIVEVGPRDGLQNESATIPTDAKLQFIDKLIDAGLRNVEATSFVHPQAIPQLADADELCRQLFASNESRAIFSALVPNEKGLERAMRSGIRRIAVFTAASDAFAQKNINMTVEQSLKMFEPLIARALADGMTVRGYVSTAFVCPYAGQVDRHRVREVTLRLVRMGVDQVAVSDTIGAAAPSDVFETVGEILQHVSRETVALHFHDTYGTALANVLAGLELGITTFDASAGGLGGCPYAPGAGGNLATEDLVYMLERMGIDTGIDLTKLVEASRWMESVLGRKLPARQLQRMGCGKSY